MSDLINREKAVKIIHDVKKEARLIPAEEFTLIASIENRISLMPSAELPFDEEAYEKGYTAGQFADKPKGRWVARIENQGGFTPAGNAVRSCSECGWIFGSHMIYPNYKYCPNCGAKMANL